MLEFKRLPLSETDADKVRSTLTSPGWEIIMDCVRSELAALKIEAGDKAVEAKVAYWKPEAQADTKEAITKAAERKIFLNVVDEMESGAYQFFRLKADF